MNLEPHYTLLHPKHLDSAWPVVAPWLIQAIGNEDSWGQIEEIRSGIATGLMQLWVVQEKQRGDLLAVFVTEPQIVGNIHSLVIRWMGGREIDRWLENIGVIERWAMRQGFAKVEIWGRPGWSRRFAHLGYREDFRVISKMVDKELH